MLALVQWNSHTLEPVDKKTNLAEEISYETNKMDFSVIIVMKQDMFVELIGGNYAINNGLVNGTEGIFKQYEKDKVKIIWIEFSSPSNGSMQWENMQKHFAINIPSTRKPITRICKQMAIMNRTHILLEQFPIQLACANTIHRSQGLTMDTL